MHKPRSATITHFARARDFFDLEMDEVDSAGMPRELSMGIRHHEQVSPCFDVSRPRLT